MKLTKHIVLMSVLSFSICYFLGIGTSTTINAYRRMPAISREVRYLDFSPCVYVNDYGGSPYDNLDDSAAFQKAYVDAVKVRGKVCMKGNGTWRF